MTFKCKLFGHKYKSEVQFSGSMLNDKNEVLGRLVVAIGQVCEHCEERKLEKTMFWAQLPAASNAAEVWLKTGVDTSLPILSQKEEDKPVTIVDDNRIQLVVNNGKIN